MIRKTPLAVLTALALAAGVAVADETTSHGGGFAQHFFSQRDANGDGKVSLDEYMTAESKRFDALDAQHKGAIGAADIMSSEGTLRRDARRADRTVRRLDENGDGIVSVAEYVDAANRRFARLDRNGDGVLTADELAPHAFASGATSPRAEAHRAFAAAAFAKLDANGDGRVTSDEFAAAARARFARLDGNGDGRVDGAEIASSELMLRRDERRAQHVIGRLDANGDAAVSREEFLAAARTRFDRLDRDGDGAITADELPRHRFAGRRRAPTQG